MSLSWIDLLTVVGIAQGFLLSLVLFKLPRSKNGSNTILSITIFIASIVLIGRLMIQHQIALEWIWWLSVVDVIIFLFGPLSYLFIRRLLFYNEIEKGLSVKHYIAPGLFIITFLAMRSLNSDQWQHFYENGYLLWVYNITELGGLTSNLIYLYLSFRLLSHYKKKVKQRIGFDQSYVQFITIYLLILTFAFISWLICYVNAYYLNGSFTYLNYNSIWFSITMLIYVVSYYSLLQPDLFRLKADEKKPVIQRLDNAVIDRIRTSLNTVMHDDKIYTHASLTMRQVADMIGTSPNDLSWFINNELDTNFYDFINKFRIDAFKEAISNAEHETKTILGIAYDCGFKSKSTFNKAFKLHTGCTPSEYIKNNSMMVRVA